MFKKILIANRGEIAVRVIRACREMGIKSVAIFSETDRSAMHVEMADEAVFIGEPPPLRSYLNMDSILRAARLTGCEAIHPGYGFLAENHKFSERCEAEGITFIGPDSKAQMLVGDKIASRKAMSEVGVPVIPGMRSAGKDIEEFKKAADRLGYPVMVKASAGGGGKGMRIVSDPSKLKGCIEEGRREAGSAFGDDTVYLEKCLVRPRHIEFQILADKEGNAIHLFERECSIQRRHQKIVEESPSTALDSELREKMGRAALDVVRATGYTNAGTVEFLLDENGDFYFLEVNARIQVEHPVTEMVTGIDLVKWQIRIAAGERLSVKQEDVVQRGHAIECRIYAEDPANNFFPSLGKIVFVKNPEGPGIRVDSGIYSGYEVSRYYDPILSKLIVWGQNREESIKRTVCALSDYIIIGIETTIPFLIDLVKHPDFLNGAIATDFLERNFKMWKKSDKCDLLDIALVSAALSGEEIQIGIKSKKVIISPWNMLGKWRIGEK